MGKRGKTQLAELKFIRLYYYIAFGIMIPICGIVLLSRSMGIFSQSPVIGFLALSTGGASTAIAGAMVARKSAKIGSYKELIRDFSDIKQPLVFYAMSFVFLLIVFGTRIFQGQLRDGQRWSVILWLFIRAILFGGIEEIGWRYIFQPTLEKKFSFMLSSILTFSCWAIWHMMYNVLDGTIFIMGVYDVANFLIGLLSTSFALGCIYHITKSLWLCVFYHALSNALIMTLTEQACLEKSVTLVFVLIISIVLVRYKTQIYKMI